MQVEQRSKGFELFNSDRDQIQNWIVEVIEKEYKNSIMKDMILPVFANPKGKKLRPLIVLNVFRMVHQQPMTEEMQEKVKSLSAAVEISHNASLLIDDVFDRDIVRRGEAAFHVRFGTFAALSAGYNLSAFVFDLATRTENTDIVREVGKVGSALSSALFLSKDLVTKKKISIDFFMDLLYRKTTALFESAAKCGALLATSDPDIVDRAREFGYLFGTAYQLRDDVLAIIGDKKDLGKEPYSDITNRFQSLITIYAMEMANDQDLEVLNDFYLRHNDHDVEEIRRILIESGAVSRVAKQTIELVNRGHQILDTFEDSESRTKMHVLLDLINFDKYYSLLFD